MLKIEKKYISNYLTMFRFILVPIIFVLIILEKNFSAICFLFLSSFTDILDGQIARKYNFISDFGKLMDPLADKATQIFTITALIIKRFVPFWVLAIITTKELVMIVTAFLLYKKKKFAVQSRWYGKLATVILFVSVVFTLLSEKFTVLSNVTLYLYYISIGMTLFAGVMYGWKNVLKQKKQF